MKRYLLFSDNLNLTVVCKNFYKLNYIFYLNEKKYTYLISKKIKVSEELDNYRLFQKILPKDIKTSGQISTCVNFDYHFVYKNGADNFNYEIDNSTNPAYTPFYYNILFSDFTTFPGYNNIQYLYLSNTTLTSIPKNIVSITLVNCIVRDTTLFNNLNQLEYIDLQSIDMIKIVPELTYNIKKLRIFDIVLLSISNLRIEKLEIGDIGGNITNTRIDKFEIIGKDPKNYIKDMISKLLN